jgi:hypothetical protein
MTGREALRRLEALRGDASDGALRQKHDALRAIHRTRFGTARDVFRAHEAACFERAYANDLQVLAASILVLQKFHQRRDLIRHAPELSDSGIAGTAIHYRFFWPMARWLAARFPGRLAIDWDDPEFEGRLASALAVLLTPAEAEAVKRLEWTARTTLDALRGRRTDAEFLIDRLAELAGGDRVREATHDAIDVAYALEPGPNGPARTFSSLRVDSVPVGFAPLHPGRPDIARELRRAPEVVTKLSRRDGAEVFDLAREAMVTRSRDLDAFAHGNPNDVWMVDDGEGLGFALIGMVPERRLFLPAVYGAVTLKNGAPIGYVQLDVLFGHAEVSYNTFPTFRGAEAGHVFGRLLAATHHVFGVSSFSIEPYQLGRGNQEGLDSGAWWFYALCGFRPRKASIARLAASEFARRKRNARYRSNLRVLAKLAEAHMFWPPRSPAVNIVTPIHAIGLAVGRHLADAGVDRTASVPACETRVRRALGIRTMRGWTAGERLWLRRWAPMLDAIDGLARWPAVDRSAAVRVVRAKGSASEIAFVKLFDAHARLRQAITSLA